MPPRHIFPGAATNSNGSGASRRTRCWSPPRPELLRAGKADEWDSGRQAAAESVGIVYAGKLEAGRRYYWTVRVAYKAEHAVDLETGAVVAVTIQPGDRGDTSSLRTTLAEAGDSITSQAGMSSAADAVGGCAEVSPVGIERVVADKGYHSKERAQQQRPSVRRNGNAAGEGPAA